MLVTYRRMNGMCNQCQTLANQIATLLNGNISGKLITLRFEYGDYFPNLKNSKNIYIYNNKCAAILVSYVYKITRKLFRNPQLFYDYDIYDDDITKLIERIYSVGFRKFNAFSGWPYYDKMALIKYQNEIRNFFIPDFRLIKDINTQIEKIKEQYEILIGIHIRRGDYKDFLGGRYYYDDEKYVETCSSIEKSIIPFGKKVCYIICSNDSVNIDKFTQKLTGNICRLESKIDIEDVYTLSRMDYIIGPPSTFNGWASFMGNIGRFWMKPEKMLVSDFSDFKVYLLED